VVPSFKRGLAVGVAVSAIAGVSAGTASAAAPRARVGSVPSLPNAARTTGAVRTGRQVQLSLSLASRDPLGMARMATAVSTPGTRAFRHYLSVSQFAHRFGATTAHIVAVRRALRAEGLKVAPVAANRMTLEASGSAAQVEHAFKTRLDSVRMADGRRAYANRTTPTLPAAVAPDVDSVVGLNSLTRLQPEGIERRTPTEQSDVAHHSTGHVVTGGPQPCAAASTAAGAIGGYTSDVIAAAYNFSGLYGLGDLGAGQSIAVFELQQLNPGDVAAFQSCYGTAAPVSFVKVGKPDPLGDDEEAALDVDQIIGLAPAASVIVYESGDSTVDGVKLYSKIINQDKAKTISVSWGSCEPKITLDGTDKSIVNQENKLFQEAALQGQSILAASGDTGSAACFRDLGSKALSVQDPSSQPFATGVGGTSLYTMGNGMPALWNPAVTTDPLMESVWNDGELKTGGGKEPAASTGGLSKLWAMPSYQRRANPALAVINGQSSGKPCGSKQCREIPDVSADGDPETGYVVYATAPNVDNPLQNVPQWTVEGGTSAAAPLWAALTAETNVLPGCRGASLGFENPVLYALDAAQPGDIKDITTASPLNPSSPNNDATGTNKGMFPVAAGYDMATGLGTPNVAAIAAGMCALRAPVFTVTVAGPKRASATLRKSTRIKVSGTDSGRIALTYAAKGLPKGLTMSPKGVITGKSTKTGTFTVTVTATDHATNTASTAFTLKVVGPPATISHTRLSGVARRRPILSFDVSRGHFGARLSSLTLHLPTGLTFGKRGKGIRLRSGHHKVHFKAKVSKNGGLTIQLKKPESHVRVTIERPSLFATSKLAKIARHHAKKADVEIHLNVTDGSKRTTRRSIKLRLKR
jgi:subtilase family serine protease